MLNEKVPLALQFMKAGDVLGVKAGKRRLDYAGPDEEIRSMTLICSDLGVAPTLQILRKILPETENSTVEDIELLWINEREDDFILSEEIEELEANFPHRLLVTRVLDDHANDPNTLVNIGLQHSLAPYEPGRLAVVLTSDTLAEKFGPLLCSLDYPMENILKVSM